MSALSSSTRAVETRLVACVLSLALGALRVAQLLHVRFTLPPSLQGALSGSPPAVETGPALHLAASGCSLALVGRWVLSAERRREEAAAGYDVRARLRGVLERGGGGGREKRVEMLDRSDRRSGRRNVEIHSV